MKKPFFLAREFVLCIGFIVFMYSCGEKGKADSAASTTGNTVKSTDTTAAKIGISGNLDTLYVSVADFNSLSDKNNLILSYVLTANDTLTFYGWSIEKKLLNCNLSYTTQPNIKLIKGNASAAAIKPVFYFGAMLLSKDAVKKIQKLISNKPACRYVFFAPVVVNANTGEIKYEIYLSDNLVNFTDTKTHNFLDPTAEELNPTPPHQVDQ
ncbi:MAG: hypothetical protein RLZZ28_461 [Bacteroidota bacterium]|jgi:hypothetical protein